MGLSQTEVLFAQQILKVGHKSLVNPHDSENDMECIFHHIGEGEPPCALLSVMAIGFANMLPFPACASSNQSSNSRSNRHTENFISNVCHP